MNMLVIILMLIAVLFAALAQGGKIEKEKTRSFQIYEYTYERKWCYVCSFLILAIMLFCSKSGTDFADYAWGYEHWGLEHLRDLETEWGYTLVVLGLRRIVENPYIGLGIVKVFSVFLIYKAAYNVKKQINLGMAILSYCTLLYIYNFHLLRMMIAIGIVFLALSYEMNGKNKRCTILLAIAFFFHYTSILVLFTYLMSKAFKKLSIKRIVSMLIATFVVLLFSSSILQFLVYRVSFFYKYTVYLNQINTGGLGLVLIFIPVILVILFRNREEYNDAMYILFTTIGIMLFTSNLAGFFLPISRLNYYFYSFFFFYIPSIPVRGERLYLSVGRRTVGFITAFSVIYYILMFIHYLNSGGIVSNGLSVYSFFWR